MIDSDTFRSVLGRFASGVSIVTTRDDDGGDHGMTVSAFCSVSLDPALVLICIDHGATMHRLLHGHRRFGISILSSEQEAYSRRFAADPDTGRFDGIAYSRGESGVVLLDGALAHLECDVVEPFRRRRPHDLHRPRRARRAAAGAAAALLSRRVCAARAVDPVVILMRHPPSVIEERSEGSLSVEAVQLPWRESDPSSLRSSG